jgi:hypothetical protein
LFRDADAVAVSDLGHGQLAVDGCLKIDVVRANTRCDGQFKLWSLGDSLGGQVGRPEGLRDDNLGVRQFLVESRSRAVFVRCHDELVPELLQVFTQSQFA